MNILITGGASGLGRAITQKLAAQLADSKIFFTYFKSEHDARRLEQEFNNVESIQCNFSLSSDCEKLVAFINENSIDVLINNAILSFVKNYFHKINTNTFYESFQQNVLPTIQITQAFIKQARNKKLGKIITVLSSIINQPTIGWSLYLAEKMYLLGLTKTWAKENIQFNITSNAVSPGFLNTSLQKEMDSRLIEEMVAKHPLKKLLTVEEVADVILFLTTSTQHINGQNLVIDPV